MTITGMKRDLELIREILLQLEADEGTTLMSSTDEFQSRFPGREPTVVAYHAFLLSEAGLIHAIEMKNRAWGGAAALPIYLTWHGHEFLAVLRDETFWKKAGRDAARSGAWTIETLLKAGATVLTTAVIESLRR